MGGHGENKGSHEGPPKTPKHGKKVAASFVEVIDMLVDVIVGYTPPDPTTTSTAGGVEGGSSHVGGGTASTGGAAAGLPSSSSAGAAGATDTLADTQEQGGASGGARGSDGGRAGGTSGNLPAVLDDAKQQMIMQVCGGLGCACVLCMLCMLCIVGCATPYATHHYCFMVLHMGTST